MRMRMGMGIYPYCICTLLYFLFAKSRRGHFQNLLVVGVQCNFFLFLGLNSNCLWPPYGIGQAIIFLPCSSFFRHLISAVAHCMSTILPRMVWP